MFETKNAKVRRLVSAGCYEEALGICKDWTWGIDHEDTDTLRRGYECLKHPEFYKQLGFNPNVEYEKAVDVLKKLYDRN